MCVERQRRLLHERELRRGFVPSRTMLGIMRHDTLTWPKEKEKKNTKSNARHESLSRFSDYVVALSGGF